ncbi:MULTISPECIES: DUF4404 family protein [unclassified Janthinobacterium]|jgi:hypothetical protein|uniref:DUF4404 family protein n=1 Tax=Janthinobacterium lividum TaxID=29581 RepID=A0A1E8PSI1_9BURK|nr:DUF4404 family protein [Janthinobacterium sp. CG_23.4]MCL6486515.1 DUF4404 family protein [Janthinobacterium lividum]MDH6160041.1 dihydroneopterin aldolase [Janthinobacterium sp. CG_23.4]OFJ49017.1 hypothetical protein BA896_009045 [Janthinobacterium lividum]
MDSKLKESLQQLHSTLQTSGPVDEELHALLQKLDVDIKLLMEKRAAQEQDQESTTYGLAERSQELSAKFAVKHPKLEPALRELGEILANMGI